MSAWLGRLSLLVLAWLHSCWAVVPAVEIDKGVSMPMLAMGSYRGSLTSCTVQEGVEQWLALGGRHIDTAHMYGTESDVGKAIKASGVPRAEIFLTTKIPGPIGAQQVTDMILNTSLPQLGVDYVDLMLIHWPCVNHSDFPNKCGGKDKEERLSTWKALVELQKAGKLRAVGVSNYNAEQVAELTAIGARPAVNQVEWHLGYHNETLVADMKAHGVALEAWAALAGPTTVAGHPGVSLGDARLKAVAARYNASTAQVALRWSTQKGVTPVTATCNKEHAKDNFAAFDFTLSQADLGYLDSLSALGASAGAHSDSPSMILV